MLIDRRIKSCPNEACECHMKKKYKADDQYCTKCGEPLIFVCAKCFCEIEDLGYKHIICKACEAKAQERKERIKDTVKTKGAKAIGGATPIAVGIGNTLLKNGQKGVVNNGAKALKEVAEKVFTKKI